MSTPAWFAFSGVDSTRAARGPSLRERRSGRAGRGSARAARLRRTARRRRTTRVDRHRPRAATRRDARRYRPPARTPGRRRRRRGARRDARLAMGLCPGERAEHAVFVGRDGARAEATGVEDRLHEGQDDGDGARRPRAGKSQARNIAHQERTLDIVLARQTHDREERARALSHRGLEGLVAAGMAAIGVGEEDVEHHRLCAGCLAAGKHGRERVSRPGPAAEFGRELGERPFVDVDDEQARVGRARPEAMALHRIECGGTDAVRSGAGQARDHAPDDESREEERAKDNRSSQQSVHAGPFARARRMLASQIPPAVGTLRSATRLAPGTERGYLARRAMVMRMTRCVRAVNIVG